MSNLVDVDPGQITRGASAAAGGRARAKLAHYCAQRTKKPLVAALFALALALIVSIVPLPHLPRLVSEHIFYVVAAVEVLSSPRRAP